MKLLITFFMLYLIIPLAHAADVEIDMLNKLGKEKMLYSKKIAQVDVGDTVFWKSKTKGHNVEFIMKGGVPDGVDKFRSAISKDAKYTFTVPGIYAYRCTPHKNMGMIGFVVVGGNKDNLESIKKVKYLGKSKKLAKSLIAQIESGG